MRLPMKIRTYLAFCLMSCFVIWIALTAIKAYASEKEDIISLNIEVINRKLLVSINQKLEALDNIVLEAQSGNMKAIDALEDILTNEAIPPIVRVECATKWSQPKIQSKVSKQMEKKVILSLINSPYSIVRNAAINAICLSKNMSNSEKFSLGVELLKVEIKIPLFMRVDTGGLRNKSDLEVNIADVMRLLRKTSDRVLVEKEIGESEKSDNIVDYMFAVKLLQCSLDLKNTTLDEIVGLAKKTKSPQLKIEFIRLYKDIYDKLLIEYALSLLNDDFIYYNNKSSIVEYPLRKISCEYLKGINSEKLIPQSIIIESSKSDQVARARHQYNKMVYPSYKVTDEEIESLIREREEHH